MSDKNTNTPDSKEEILDESAKKLEAKVKDYFKRNPNATEVYICEGRLFATKGGADSYGEATKHNRPKQ